MNAPSPPPQAPGNAGISWTCTLVATVASFAYILALSLAPAVLARPVSPGSRVSIGLVAGLALAALLVALAMVYTWIVNRREPG